MIVQNSTYSSALSGVQRGMNRLNQAANDIARSGTTDQKADVIDVTKGLVEAKQAENDVEASLFTIKVADTMVGSLLDIRI